MPVEKETLYRVLNSNLKTALLVKVDDMGYATIEDYQESTRAPEFCRLLRGLANQIEQDYPDILAASAVLAGMQIPRAEAPCPSFKSILPLQAEEQHA